MPSSRRVKRRSRRAVRARRCVRRAERRVARTPLRCDRLRRAGHRRWAHDRRAILEDDGAIRRRRLVGIVSMGIENDRFDAVVTQRLLQDGVLFDGTRVHGAGLAGHRARAFDARVRCDQQREAQPSGGRTHQSRPEMHANFSRVCHRYGTPFRTRYATALQVRCRPTYRIAWYGCGSGESAKKSAMSVASRSLSPSGGNPKISSWVFTTLGTERWAWPT